MTKDKKVTRDSFEQDYLAIVKNFPAGVQWTKPG